MLRTLCVRTSAAAGEHALHLGLLLVLAHALQEALRARFRLGVDLPGRSALPGEDDVRLLEGDEAAGVEQVTRVVNHGLEINLLDALADGSLPCRNPLPRLEVLRVMLLRLLGRAREVLARELQASHATRTSRVTHAYSGKARA